MPLKDRISRSTRRKTDAKSLGLQRIVHIVGGTSGEPVASPTIEDLDTPFCFIQAVDDQLRADADRAAASTSPLLMLGEPGTGRSTLAHYIHGCSSHRDGPFVEFHCDSVPREQIASRLLGPDAHSSAAQEPGPEPAARRSEGGTLLISDFELAADILYPYLEPYFESGVKSRLGLTRAKTPGHKLIIAANQNVRNHISQAIWRRLTLWPPLLLTPIRMQRRKKWKLFQHFVESYAQNTGIVTPVSVDFLLYFFVVSYGWPGNAGQVRGFAEFLCQTSFNEKRELLLDDEFSIFDHTDAFAPPDTEHPVRLSGQQKLYRNRVHRNFVEIVKTLQSSEFGVQWRDLSKASPGRTGRWQYPLVSWNDPHFNSAEICARCGQSYSAALALLKDWDERTPAAKLRYKATDIPWVTRTRTKRVAAGRTEYDLAQLVAYGLISGDIEDKEDFLLRVYTAMIEQAPGKSHREYQEMGIPRARLKELLG